MYLGEPVNLNTPQMRKAMEDLRRGYNIVDLSHTIEIHDAFNDDWLARRGSWNISKDDKGTVTLGISTHFTKEDLICSDSDLKMLIVSRLELTRDELDQIASKLLEEKKS
jgi:hypothetical protein